MARTQVLDDEKRNIIVALAGAGMRMHVIARYVRVDRATIVRHRQQNDDFDQRIRQAQAAAQLKPLEAMRRAAQTHWRAAAWMLEREERHAAERRARRVVSPAAEHQLCAELQILVHSADIEPLKAIALVQQMDQTVGRWAKQQLDSGATSHCVGSPLVSLLDDVLFPLDNPQASAASIAALFNRSAAIETTEPRDTTSQTPRKQGENATEPISQPVQLQR
jgi:hypothetical protein